MTDSWQQCTKLKINTIIAYFEFIDNTLYDNTNNMQRACKNKQMGLYLLSIIYTLL